MTGKNVQRVGGRHREPSGSSFPLSKESSDGTDRVFFISVTDGAVEVNGHCWGWNADSRAQQSVPGYNGFHFTQWGFNVTDEPSTAWGLSSTFAHAGTVTPDNLCK